MSKRDQYHVRTVYPDGAEYFVKSYARVEDATRKAARIARIGYQESIFGLEVIIWDERGEISRETVK